MNSFHSTIDIRHLGIGQWQSPIGNPHPASIPLASTPGRSYDPSAPASLEARLFQPWDCAMIARFHVSSARPWSYSGCAN
jgi:hypothetical protein